jgi:UDP-2,4-diacetamido-2,4,6-trideoxy-beta-L-altropyranose hydrolase
MVKILFLTEVGKKLGLGHFSRCASLADGFNYYKHSVDIIVRGLSQNMNPFKGYNVSMADWFDVDYLNQILGQYSIVVIDSYIAEMWLLEYIAENSAFPVFIIDSQLRYFPRGAILFPSVYASEYKNLRNSEFKLIAGRDYLLFGSKMWNLPQYVVKDRVNNVGISLGAYYDDEIVSKICKSVSIAFPGAMIQLYGSGKAIKYPGVLIKNCGLIDKDKYISQLFDRDLMLVSGGQSLNECLLVGLPSICIVIAENQVQNANAWQNLGATKCLLVGDKDFSNSLLELLLTYREIAYRKTLSLKAKKSINSNGAKLSASSIVDIYHEQQAIL